jgi:DNA mismatch endonuclease (patch repair protein)
MPRNNAKLWREKFERTVLRDRRNLRRLKTAGWNVLILWECKLGTESDIRATLDGFLREEAANSR